MRSQKVNFINTQGEKLAARIELPVNQHPHTFVLFAHCFTCNKNLSAVRNISRALTMKGFGVMRFDFTGLGESEGDFADTNFSSNIEDIVQAANFLKAEYLAPALLVGHSLGGAAVLRAGYELDFVRGIATIGAPFDPEHVKHLLQSDLGTIESTGIAEVSIGGRPFTVKKQFLEDIQENKLLDRIKKMRKSLLIMHSPQDMTVAIENAANIYNAAHHPKSFVSLDGADHLLSEKKDSIYVGEVIATWASRYLDIPEKEQLKAEKEVAVRLGQEGYTTDIMVRHHGLIADEPESVGGDDFGPSPYELLTAGLGACTAMTMQMYARRKKWPLEDVEVQLEHYKDHASDIVQPEDSKSKIDHFDRVIKIKGDLTEEQRQKLLEIANKCPVHRTLHSEIKVNTRLAE